MGQRINIQLLDGVTKEAVEAVLIEDVSDAEIALADDSWKAFLQPILENRSGLSRANFGAWYDFVVAAYQAIQAKGNTIDNFPENTHWDWRIKTQRVVAGRRVFSVECNNEAQGLMLIRSDKLCRLTDKAGQPLIYVDEVASAPWNLPDLVSVAQFRGVGYVFIGKAIELSHDAGWEGRIGLHALPKAESFYRKCKMTDLGTDNQYQNLRYFEMSSTQARDFVERTKK